VPAFAEHLSPGVCVAAHTNLPAARQRASERLSPLPTTVYGGLWGLWSSQHFSPRHGRQNHPVICFCQARA
jgi:hypothetical protein